MGKFSLYNIPLKSLEEGAHKFEYVLNDQYFKLIGDDESDIKRGTAKVDVTVKRISSTYEFSFELKGEVSVPCNRCLDDMPMEIDTKNRLFVKLGAEYTEESDEVVVVPEAEGEINIAWFLYEFVALSIPIKHVHAPGKCNKAMTTKLKKHKAVNSDDEDEDQDDTVDFVDGSEDITSSESDPRWDTLKGLVDEE